MKLQLVVLENSRRKHVFPLRSRETLVGRGEDCSVRIPSAEVSRRHCRLCQAGGRVTVTDLNSVNGTYLNEELVTGDAVVVAGDQLRVGPVTFYLEEAAARPAGPSLSARRATGNAPGRSVPKPAGGFEPEEIVEDPALAPLRSLADSDPGAQSQKPAPPVLDPSESLNLAPLGQLRDLLLELDLSGEPEEKPRNKVDRHDR
jgi:pSer/pThr/pTyr-binding forkhead associated (FHA) protein